MKTRVTTASCPSQKAALRSLSPSQKKGSVSSTNAETEKTMSPMTNDDQQRASIDEEGSSSSRQMRSRVVPGSVSRQLIPGSEPVMVPSKERELLPGPGERERALAALLRGGSNSRSEV